MTFLGLEARTNLPKVTYPTALDYFVFLSFMYIFSTVVQVGWLHVLGIWTNIVESAINPAEFTINPGLP